MFHSREGLFFQRLSDNSVRIIKYKEARTDSEILFEIILDDSIWASIISSMSKHGEIDNGYYNALIFHNKDYEIKEK